ncbi:MAG: choice-of-anchor L domain-containing protein [Pseudomonadota bacterium]|nr:choice-of-anchor L domain-containing protein [Pseudomonadota bacterium]
MFYYRKTLLLVTLLLSAPVFSVATTEFKTTSLGFLGGLSYKDLIDEIIAPAASGISYDNAQLPYYFSPLSAGIFENGYDAGLEFDSGIILSTGKIQYAKGPNECLDNTTFIGSKRLDADLQQLTAENTFDTVALEFDFTSTQDHIEFNFIFASDEYSTNLAETFEDVFGFFLTDTQSGETQNLAVVPGTSTPITTRSINATVNSAYYRDNHPLPQQRRGDSSDQIEIATNSCGTQLTDAITPFNLEFDGLTQVLKARADVIPQRTYHLKIVIADGKESKVDSAVFIQSHSFTSDSDYSGGDKVLACNLYAVHDEQVNDSQFFRIDPETQQVSAVGGLHAGFDIEAIAINLLTNTIYAASGKDAQSAPGTLYTLDIDSGQLTAIGSLKLDEGSAESHVIEDISGLSFNPETNSLWGWAPNKGLFVLHVDELNNGKKALLKWDNPKEFGDITWNTAGNAIYLADKQKLWYFDGTTEQEQALCSWANGEKIEALEMTPEGYLLLGIDGDPVVHLMDVNALSGDGNQACNVESSYIQTEYNDIEGLSWRCVQTP